MSDCRLRPAAVLAPAALDVVPSKTLDTCRPGCPGSRTGLPQPRIGLSHVHPSRGPCRRATSVSARATTIPNRGLVGKTSLPLRIGCAQAPEALHQLWREKPGRPRSLEGDASWSAAIAGRGSPVWGRWRSPTLGMSGRDGSIYARPCIRLVMIPGQRHTGSRCQSGRTRPAGGLSEGRQATPGGEQ
jgi:hypothetical protein